MVKAIHNNVVLQKRVLTNSSGIYMPSVNSDSFIVLNIGPEVSTIKVGQIVVLNAVPKLFKEKLEEYYITNIENVIAIVEE